MYAAKRFDSQMLTEVGAMAFVLKAAKTPEMDAKSKKVIRRREKTFVTPCENMDLKMDWTFIT